MSTGSWPAPPRDWEETRATFHLWTQVIGKLRLANTPLTNHWWNVPLYVTARGLTTSLIPHPGGRSFQVDFDLVDHALVIASSDGQRRTRPLEPQSVADFYGAVMALLDELALHTSIWTRPVEIPDAIPFERDDVHASYDPEQVHRFWQTLVETQRVLELFRSRFLGKMSPVHFFWGGFDLAVTRFSGRAAPPYATSVPNCGPEVMLEAYSHEVSSCGAWPVPSGALTFYSYAYPEPDGYAGMPVRPAEAEYDPTLKEFVLSYQAVRQSSDPDAVLLEFLQTTYEAAAVAGKWDRGSLERTGRGGRPLFA